MFVGHITGRALELDAAGKTVGITVTGCKQLSPLGCGIVGPSLAELEGAALAGFLDK